MNERNRRVKNDVLTAARSATKQLDTLSALLQELDLHDPAVHAHDVLDAQGAVGTAHRKLADVESLSIKWGAQ